LETHLLVMDHKQAIRLKVTRMTVYLQSKIVEAFNQNNEVYYLFFYKNDYLTTTKAIRLRRRSHIEHAFRYGTVFQYPHPLINSVLPSNITLHMYSFNQLTRNCDSQYTPQETALITTFFESFIPKKKLFEFIQSIFYQYRRNGQMFASYRIIRILLDFYPNQWVKHLANTLEFKKYDDLYNQFAEKLFDKDMLFIEKALYHQRENDQRFQQLKSLLQKESRWIDLIALLINKISLSNAFSDDYSLLLQLLDTHLNEEESAVILEELSRHVPEFKQLQDDLLNKYLTLNKPDKVINYMTTNQLKLTPSQASSFQSMLINLDVENQPIQLEQLNTFLIPFFQSHPEKAEKLLQQCINVLFKKHDLVYIHEWLAPLNTTKQTLPISQKIEEMNKLTNDPDHQLLLGELYYHFKQFDHAIECFSWEMELNNTNPKPVQWLSKIYLEKGMKHESQAYQQLYIDMQKRA
jgi:hypothetical protein